MGEALIEMFHQKAPRVRFREGFGMTEAGGAITFGRKDQSLLGSSGQLLPNMRSEQIFESFIKYLLNFNYVFHY